MSDCLFCRIIARHSPAEITYEDDAVLAFKDIYPKAPVHHLIVPKRHIASVLEAEPCDGWPWPCCPASMPRSKMSHDLERVSCWRPHLAADNARRGTP